MTSRTDPKHHKCKTLETIMKFFVCMLLVGAAWAAPSETRDKRGIFGEPGGLLTPHLHHDLHYDLHHDFHHDLHHDFHHDLHHDLHHGHLHYDLPHLHVPSVHSYPLVSHSHLHAPIISDHFDHAHLHAPVIHEVAPLHAHIHPPTTIIKRVKHIKLGGW